MARRPAWNQRTPARYDSEGTPLLPVRRRPALRNNHPRTARRLRRAVRLRQAVGAQDGHGRCSRRGVACAGRSSCTAYPRARSSVVYRRPGAARYQARRRDTAYNGGSGTSSLVNVQCTAGSALMCQNRVVRTPERMMGSLISSSEPITLLSNEFSSAPSRHTGRSRSPS